MVSLGKYYSCNLILKPQNPVQILEVLSLFLCFSKLRKDRIVSDYSHKSGNLLQIIQIHLHAPWMIVSYWCLQIYEENVLKITLGSTVLLLFIRNHTQGILAPGEGFDLCHLYVF